MLKQGAGFGVVGIVASVLGAALSGTAFSPGGLRGYVVVGSAGFAGNSLPWGAQPLIGAAFVGFVVGAVLGSALHAIGVRVTGDRVVRAGSVAAVGVLGVLVGLAPALIVVGSAFAGASWVDGIATEYMTLPLYAVCAVLAWVSAIVAVRLLMTRWGDAWSARTVRATAVAAPVGGACATAAGVAAAWYLGFDTSAPTWVVVVTVVALVLAVSFGVARRWAVNSAAPDPGH
ncbi:hypothetical protein [Rhodococcoides kroppenstedtii]|uniref:hypothetical protein n=1 Tax=Rhodococcoides kroppenstedtii TaxID=293050 RepID=UPI00362F6AFD